MGFILGLIASGTFGLIPLFSLPLLHDGVTVETALVYRFGIATVLMWLILLARRERVLVPGIVFLKLAGVSALYMLAVLLFFHAFSFLPSGVVATINFLFPLMVMLIMIMFFHERFRWHTALAVLLAIAGVALVSSGPGLEQGIEPGAAQAASGGLGAVLMGTSLSLLAGLANALYFVSLQVARIPNLNGLQMTFYIMFFGALYALLNCLTCGQLQWLDNGRDLGLAVLLSLVTAVISNLALVMAIRRIGSTTSAILGVMEPLTAVAVGITVFSEPFGVWLLAGMALIVTSVLMVVLAPRPRN